MEFKKGEGEQTTHDEIDALFADRPAELVKIRDNEKFLKDIAEKPIDPEHETVEVFGTSVNLNAILKDNIYNRSIYVLDMLCDMFQSMSIEKLIKYRKKRKLPIDFLWLIIIIMGIAVAVVILILFMSGGM